MQYDLERWGSMQLVAQCAIGLTEKIHQYFECWDWIQAMARKPESDRPGRPLDALQTALAAGTFPCIFVLLRIFCCLPVATASGERTFSALKHVKSYLRSTVTEDRLNGLAQMYINKDITIDYGQVIYIFSKTNRRLKLHWSLIGYCSCKQCSWLSCQHWLY